MTQKCLRKAVCVIIFIHSTLITEESIITGVTTFLNKYGLNCQEIAYKIVSNRSAEVLGTEFSFTEILTRGLSHFKAEVRFVRS